MKVPKNWCFWTVVLEKTLECPLDCKEIKPVNPKGNQPWIFIGRTAAEAPKLWPPDMKSRLIGKDGDAGKDWKQKGDGEQQKMMWLNSITDSMNMNLNKLWETVGDRQGHRIPKSRIWPSNPTTTKWKLLGRETLVKRRHLSYLSLHNNIVINSVALNNTCLSSCSFWGSGVKA